MMTSAELDDQKLTSLVSWILLHTLYCRLGSEMHPEDIRELVGDEQIQEERHLNDLASLIDSA